MANFNNIESMARNDIEVLKEKERTYGGSYKKRGGVGCFFVSVRKFDRIEQMAKGYGYDIFEAGVATVDEGDSSLLEQIRDARRYLLLIEDEICSQLEGLEPDGSYVNQDPDMRKRV